MKSINGNIKNLNEKLFGRFSVRNSIFTKKRILFCENRPFITWGIIAYIVPKGKSFNTNTPILEIEDDIPFADGDIIAIQKNGTANVVWEVNTKHNALYVTDICNSKCIMCPQIERILPRYKECSTILDIVNLKNINEIGITGGEPTTDINRLIELLKKIAKKSPKIKVHILTNGRCFADINNVMKMISLKDVQISYGIPLYSDVAEIHDYIVGVDGAFKETLQGIYNLGKYKQNIEIRTVILKQNYMQLKDLAVFIYRNIPFINHVVLMGMEYHGNAEINYDLIAIDPIEYKQELFESVREYVRYNLNIDIYNIPLCLVDKRIRKFCRDSISTWKKIYLPQCELCKCKNKCSGVFETSFKQSSNIQSLL